MSIAECVAERMSNNLLKDVQKVIYWQRLNDKCGANFKRSF